jgi:hypothetical protein
VIIEEAASVHTILAFSALNSIAKYHQTVKNGLFAFLCHHIINGLWLLLQILQKTQLNFIDIFVSIKFYIFIITQTCAFFKSMIRKITIGLEARSVNFRHLIALVFRSTWTFIWKTLRAEYVPQEQLKIAIALGGRRWEFSPEGLINRAGGWLACSEKWANTHAERRAK